VGGFLQPIFFGRLEVSGILNQESDRPSAGAPQGGGCIERTVTGLGFELVDVERSARGLLRIFIDRIPGHTYPEAQGSGEFVTVDDCEVVTRQLLYALEVDGVAFERLEVSSPGLDRPLRKVSDFERFAGYAVELTLKAAFQGRKHWKGVLGRSGADWSLHLSPAPVGKGSTKSKASGKGKGSPAGPDAAGESGEPDSELTFQLDEVREARLVPVIDFKGRGRSAASAAG
jgi:ribosome maturation factor RimP